MHREVHKELEKKMDKTISFLKEDLGSIRAGRANPKLVDKIKVDYYGTPTPLNQLSNISVPEPRCLLIQPYDINALKDIEKTLGASDLGVNPSNDGKVIRIMIPELTEERRKDLLKTVKKETENAKVALRNERRDTNEKLKKMEKNGDLTKDDLRDAETEVQKITDKYIKKVEEIYSDKETEILEV
ncbi:ribosome recycling factor [Dethiosulfatibacter aminovorans DSM 17477]|uniref:Ribosome-recycling factor n=1 Tax=Dethiosulfatibacter aminovorans DSM 17477 TaxID=1121476 RepID=A0A1M6DEX5_9FIRM|nr:ribosome recycling factor [Dethiosulfatibacter aminovorans]SHI71629.1 ribosome recycling factor [Dethiosulfatibacter aminovorans DSM 17477]